MTYTRWASMQSGPPSFQMTRASQSPILDAHGVQVFPSPLSVTQTIAKQRGRFKYHYRLQLKRPHHHIPPPSPPQPPSFHAPPEIRGHDLHHPRRSSMNTPHRLASASLSQTTAPGPCSRILPSRRFSIHYPQSPSAAQARVFHRRAHASKGAGTHSVGLVGYGECGSATTWSVESEAESGTERSFPSAKWDGR